MSFIISTVVDAQNVHNVLEAADNPQTFHQALLLIAAMARLAPDAILHNVMPVFTFMGSNVFHRDDTYSFRVVQKARVMFPQCSTSHSRDRTFRLSIASCLSWLHPFAATMPSVWTCIWPLAISCAFSPMQQTTFLGIVAQSEPCSSRSTATFTNLWQVLCSSCRRSRP